MLLAESLEMSSESAKTFRAEALSYMPMLRKAMSFRDLSLLKLIALS